jgi:hypothetical protein
MDMVLITTVTESLIIWKDTTEPIQMTRTEMVYLTIMSRDTMVTITWTVFVIIMTATMALIIT